MTRNRSLFWGGLKPTIVKGTDCKSPKQCKLNIVCFEIMVWILIIRLFVDVVDVVYVGLDEA